MRSTATDPRTTLILAHLEDADRLAQRYATKLPNVDKDDLRGAAALGLVQSATRYDHERSSDFWAYARRRVQGAIQDYLRTNSLLSGTRGHYEELPEVYREYEPADPSSPEEAVMEAELLERLRDVMDLLTERERMVVELMFYEGRSAKEIAATLGISEARVSQLKHSSISKLRSMSQDLV